MRVIVKMIINHFSPCLLGGSEQDFCVSGSTPPKSGFLIQEIPAPCQVNTQGLHYIVTVVSILAVIVDLSVSHFKQRPPVLSELCKVQTSPHLPDS